MQIIPVSVDTNTGKRYCKSDDILSALDMMPFRDSHHKIFLGDMHEMWEGERVADLSTPLCNTLKIGFECVVVMPDKEYIANPQVLDLVQDMGAKWINGEFIDVEGYEHFCPMPGKALIDQDENIVDVNIGGISLDTLEDGIALCFKSGNKEYAR